MEREEKIYFDDDIHWSWGEQKKTHLRKINVVPPLKMDTWNKWSNVPMDMYGLLLPRGFHSNSNKCASRAISDLESFLRMQNQGKIETSMSP